MGFPTSLHQRNWDFSRISTVLSSSDAAGCNNWSGRWLQDLGGLVCVFAGLGEPLMPTGAAVPQSVIQHSPAPPEHPLCSWDPQGFSSILSPVLLSLPSLSLAVANPGMESQGDPGLAESLGQAWGSHLSEGPSRLEPLQGPFLSVTSPRGAGAGG